MKKIYRVSYIDASCQVWFHLAKEFQDWLLLKKSPLKLLGQMEPNLAGSIYVRSSIKFLRFVPFRKQTFPPRAILFSDWLDASCQVWFHLANEFQGRRFV
jgi:hypothetical protein